ncbi:3-hydroxybenzoate 4-monooxygenase [Sulfitobacter sp. JBTF-M27]|uniref:3-hydroxybenzoate 4-monooxygenase n=1 Tax=Sulfitobacter sediminilitoris TaxID=2698830 RepID=A0A6P0CFU4_9RHOB|nr:FAD-dependent monooxygenase [Sulfitobacter sediminilitoris]NEK25061.1 3-hydroxybenzoate 4-monooxygenase [Sulfitobacter sediminilitoris]
MQYHLNGFRPGDPNLKPAAPARADTDIDVLIVGCGPAGLTLAAYLSNFPDIKTVIVERKDGPMEKGQADGVSCRSMEMFNCFGFAEKVMREAYWVNEATFWKPDPAEPSRIIRNGRVQDVEDGLSEMPHVILNQARVHDMYLDVMRKSPTRLEPLYSRQFVDLSVEEDDPDAPVSVTLERTDTGAKETLRARYVVGCDGARSGVRKAIGRSLDGDSAHQAWGVMDVLLNTDFPDIRFKSLIQSDTEGTVLIIPREGGYLARLYVELDKLNEDERVANRDLSLDDLIAAAGRIMAPYSLDVKEVAWWSIYEIGHRLTDKFDDVTAETAQKPRVFIAGDACHTHSPKAGQGMNVSMGDAFNLGWKLVTVLLGRMPDDLLHSYSGERQAVAQALIDFDHEWARIMSAPPQEREHDGQTLPKFQQYFIEHGRYTAGVSVRYGASRLTGDTTYQDLAQGFEIGMRFHSAHVVRLADAKQMHLGHVQKADARWLICAFAGEGSVAEQIAQLDTFSGQAAQIVDRFTPTGADPDQIIDLRAILQAHHHDAQISDMPAALRPVKGELGLQDYEKVFCADQRPAQNIYDLRGIDRETGCVVVVRPDQYVAQILPLDALDALESFCNGLFLPCA